MPKPACKTFLLAVAASLMLAACGGGSDSGTDSPGASNPSPGNPDSGNPGDGDTGGPGQPTANGVATLSWVRPVENDDGSILTDLAGYRIYHGTRPAAMSLAATIDDPGATGHVVEQLPSGTHYFAVSAYNRDNRESERSATASKVIP